MVPSIERIANVCYSYYGVSVDRIPDRAKGPWLSAVRAYAICSKKHYGYTYSAAGIHINKDHSTMKLHYESALSMFYTDRYFNHDVDHIINVLNGNIELESIPNSPNIQAVKDQMHLLIHNMNMLTDQIDKISQTRDIIKAQIESICKA